jgi:hypothetical protein
MFCCKKKMKNLDGFDLGLIKLGVASFVLFLITVPTPARNMLMQWVHSVHWGWFLGVAILAMIRPWKKMWM